MDVIIKTEQRSVCVFKNNYRMILLVLTGSTCTIHMLYIYVYTIPSPSTTHSGIQKQNENSTFPLLQCADGQQNGLNSL